VQAARLAAHWGGCPGVRPQLTSDVYSIQTSRLTDTVLRYTGMPVTYGIQFSFRH
jgi:hypothetical protein